MSRVVETLTTRECLRRLRDHDVARVSLSVRAMPVIIPVLYQLEGDSVHFGAPLDPTFPPTCDRAVIAFEVDGFASASDQQWCVMVVGVANLLSDQAVSLSLERLTGRSVRQPVGATPVVPRLRQPLS